MPTVAPKERINVTYQPATGDVAGGLELPLKILMVGDYTLREDDRQVEDRKPINVNANNFEDVLKEHKLEININVADKLSGEEDAQLPMNLKFNSLKDFSPEGLVKQVPELRKLLELRQALTALQGPLGNFPKFKKRIQTLLDDEETRKKLISEIGIDESAGGGEG
jgi:type VI secretion system protein ImpB